MRCHSVEALWAPEPPQHDVVAMVAMEEPFSLWTGGSRGEIIHWKLHSRPPDPQDAAKQELWPVAILCGHTAGIADLARCRIDEVNENGFNSNGASLDKGLCGFHDIIVSACIEGWFCAWDSLNGRCRRRRRLPPWIGSPWIMTTLPKTPRYIAIVCDGTVSAFCQSSSFKDGDNGVRRLVENARTMALENSGSIRKNMRGSLFIMDSSTLGMLQVIYNGFFGIGPVKSVLALPDGDLNHKVLLCDSVGQIRSWNVSMGIQGKHDSEADSSEEIVSICSGFESGNAQRVSFSQDGLYVLLVFASHWVIYLAMDQSKAAEESLNLNGRFGASRSHSLQGGFFLNKTNQFIKCKDADGTVNLFLVWETSGGATLFSLQKSIDHSFVVKELCRLPSISVGCQKEPNITYLQSDELLICVGCGSFHMPSTSMHDTWVKLWLLPLKHLFNPNSLISFKETEVSNGVSEIKLKEFLRSPNFYGEGGLREHWTKHFIDCHAQKIRQKSSSEDDQPLNDFAALETLVSRSLVLDKDIAVLSKSSLWVTASLLSFDKSTIPLAFVLGFNNGNITILKLHIFRSPLNRRNGASVERDDYSNQRLFKHTDSIICLAEHSISIEVNSGKTIRKFLISGGMDCLTCIWDLEKGDLLAVLHSHVTSVQQILVPSAGTDVPWSNCFLTVGEDGCLALTSLETLQVERMFVGHPCQPKLIAWDGVRGYLFCLCSTSLMASDVLFIWDLKSGTLERVLRGAAAHSMFDNLAKQLQGSSIVRSLLSGPATSMSTFLQGDIESPRHLETGIIGLQEDKDKRQSFVESPSNKVMGGLEKLSSRITQALNQGGKVALSTVKENLPKSDAGQSSSHRNLFHRQPPIKGASPFPGVGALQFDLFTLMAPDLGRLGQGGKVGEQTKMDPISNPPAEDMIINKVNGDAEVVESLDADKENDPVVQEGLLAAKLDKCELASSLGSFEGCLLRTSLAFLHLWGANLELDKCLEKELRISQPKNVGAAAGFPGDRGATTLLLPGLHFKFELWTVSPEFCALRSLTIVATALRMTTLSRLTSNASRALAAFYTRGLAEKFPRVKAPSLELYACFWQDPSEHVRMAARSLFHCAASRGIPSILSAKSTLTVAEQDSNFGNDNNNSLLRLEQKLVDECTVKNIIWPESISASAEINEWLDSFEGQSWTAVVGGTNQDARAGRIIMAAALAVWYPGLVKPELAPSVAPYLVKLVKAVVDRHSAVAAELLADGMDSVWQHLLSKEIPQLISDIFLLIDCLSGSGSAKSNFTSSPATAMALRETLTGSLLPCLAMTDIKSFLQIVQTQLAVASLGSSVHMISLMTIIRIIRGLPRTVVYYLSEVTSIILQTMNCGKHCYQTAMAAVREMVRVYPMVSLHQSSGKLAVGDAVGDVHSLAIQIFDLNSATKLRVLDASGPPGHPALLASNGMGGISALAFAEDGEGVVAFSQHGLIIRWWSLNSVWWEKFSRLTTPVQCNKLVLVPPWAGFSPKSSRSSMMEIIGNPSVISNFPEESKAGNHEDAASRTPGQSIDLSFKLEWKPGKKILLLHHGQELGIFQL